MKRKLLLAALCVVGALGFKANAQSWTSGSEVSEGEFYLYNIDADRYLTNGSSWATHSVVDGQGTVLTISTQGTGYKLNSGVGGGQGPYVWGSWMNDNNGSGYWTFTKVTVDGYTNVYTLQRSSDSQYLVWNGGGDGAWGNEVNTQASSDSKCYWMLIPKSTRQDLAGSNASAANPLDVTYLINDPDFEKRVSNSTNATPAAGSGQTSAYWNNGGFWRQYSAQTFANAIFFEKYAGGGLTTADAIYQSPTLVAGTYCLSATAYSSCTEAYLYAGSAEKRVSTAGKYTVYFHVDAEASVELGMKIKAGGSGTWVAFDNVRLYYCGDDMSPFREELDAAVAAASAVAGTIPSAAYDVLAAVVTAQNQDYSTVAEYTAAASAIVEATNTAKALQANFTRYNNVKTATLAVSANVNTSTADTELDAATTNDDIDAAIATLRAAFLAELPNVNIPTDPGYIDVTSVMVDNASVRQNTNYWTKEGTYDGSHSFGVCNYNECEFYSHNFKFYQTLALTPGTWEFGVTGFHRAGNHNTHFYAGEDKILIPGVESSVVNTMAQAETYFNDGNGKVALKFLVEEDQNIEIGINNQDTETDKWTIFRDFTLKYYGEPDYSVYEAQWAEAVTAAQTALTTYAEYDGFVTTEKTTLTTAKDNAPTSTEKKDGYVTKINALNDATAAYIAACTKFVSAKAAIAKANAIKEAHNFASAEATTTFTNAINAISDKYDNRTLTQEEAAAAGTTLGTAQTGVRANPDGAAVNYLENGFGLTDYEASLYINTWSTEGDNDGTGFSVPFFEYWVSEANALAENTWTGTLTGLHNGLYKVSAWVRVRAKNETAATDATGITMDVNGGGEGDYAAVDVTEGEQIGTTQFSIASYEALGLVKDGTLNLNFNIAADNNISWLSFKNVKYTKERDLTPEEMAVAPTAITLYNGETEVTEAIALNATTSTVTLTPSYTPAEATEGYITWETSDATVATVANGVVTAVSSGTATITATSTLDPTVSATATVTVTFPESTVPEYANNGATRTVYNYGPNLIKNGSFEYSDNFYGWTSGDGSKMNSSNFSIQTSGAYDGSNYLKASKDAGQTNAGSIYTSWPVEAGKKYVFSYQMKNSSAVNNDDYIRTSLSATTAEDATSYSDDFKAVSCGTDWTELSYEFTVPEGKNYLVFSARWLKSSKSFDNFYLCEVLDEPTTVGNVDYATAAIPTANIGTGAFQYSQDAIDAANALVQGTATVAEVEAAYNALVTLNAPVEGQLYNVVNITSGYAYANKALTFQSASDADLNANTTTMGWLEEPGSIYPQGVKFTAVDGTLNGYTLSYTRADGNVVYVSTGSKSGLGTDNNQLRPTTDATKALTFVVTSVGDNHWYLNNTVTGNNVGATSGQAGFYTAGGANKDLKIQEAVNNEVSLNILAANQYGTLIIPFNAEIPEGVTAYTVTGTSGEWMTVEEADEFEANTPYFVEAVGGVNETLAGIGSAYTDPTYTEGKLTGVYKATDAPVDSYVLQKIGDKVAFYQVEAGNEPTVPANRAYLSDAAGANVRALFFPAGEATGIEAIGVLTSGNYDAIYTAGGAKVNSLQKGLNIVVKDGKSYKIFVK